MPAEEVSLKNGEEKPKEPIPILGTPSDFLKQWSQSRASEGEEKHEKARAVVDESNRILSESKKVETDGPQEGKRRPFIKRQIDEKNQFKKEKEELEVKLQESQGRLEQYEKDIAELKSRSEDADTKKERDVLKVELSKVKQALEEAEKFNSSLKTELTFHNWRHSDEFMQEFQQPLEASYAKVLEFIADDKGKMALFQKAATAHQNYLSAPNGQERAAFSAERDEYLSQIEGDIHGYQQRSFVRAIDSFITASERHHAGLTAWQEFSQKKQEESQRRSQKARESSLNTWRGAYEASAKAVAEFDKLPSSIIDDAKRLGLDTDFSYDDAIAEDMVQPQNKFGPDEIMRLVHQGRVHKKMAVTMAVLQNKVKEYQATIEKLTKAGSSGGGASQSTAEPKDDLKSFLKRFQRK